MCEKHPLSNICTPGDDPVGALYDRYPNYKIFRSQEKTKLEAEVDCKNLGPGWSLAFLRSKESFNF